MKYYSDNSPKIFNVNQYHDMFFILFNNLLNSLKVKFSETTFLLLKYSLDDLKNLFMISNCLSHLFSCPRSVFARNDCLYCSRLFIEENIRPKNFTIINDFNFKYYLDSYIQGKLSSKSVDVLARFKTIVFFKSFDELSVINSDRKRCLTTFIVQDYFHFVLVFFEVQLRIFINFFYKIVENEYVKKEDEIRFFLEQCFHFTFDFVSYCIGKVNIVFFEEIFDEMNFNEYDSNIIKVINKKYIEYCDRKYAC